MFENREGGARHLVGGLKVLALRDPVVLAIPRGGIVPGAFVARQLHAELDVILANKLRSPERADLTIGAVAEDGEVYLNHWIELVSGIPQAYVEKERQRQLQVLRRRQRLFRAARPAVDVAGRTVILVDDGVITGATMLAALHALKAKNPYETIVAVPVGAPERLKVIAGECDQVVCALAPPDFHTIGQHYSSFEPVLDQDVARVLREFVPVSSTASGSRQPLNDSSLSSAAGFRPGEPLGISDAI